MSQQAMTLNLLEQLDLKSAKLVGTPAAEVNLLPAQETSSFRILTGALLWITRCTRPNIGLRYIK
jgi:hypothetical protein